jgi:hypothetical protein
MVAVYALAGIGVGVAASTGGVVGNVFIVGPDVE